jgi:hypothetical protein
MRHFKHYRQQYLQPLFATLLLFMSTFIILLPHPAAAVGTTSLIALTNQQRASAGLPALKYNGSLSSSAYMKAQDMLAKNYWSHDSPDGLTAWTFISRVGYPYTTAGENLAKGFNTDSEVINGWMNSPGHRANILNSAYRDVGIAIVVGELSGITTTLVVAHYGATATKSASVSSPKPNTTTYQSNYRPLTLPKVQVADTPPGPRPAPKPPKPTFGEVLWKMVFNKSDNILGVTLKRA